MKRCFAILVAFGLLLTRPAYGQPEALGSDRVEKNVIYGMYSGLALLMDVRHPVSSNGVGVMYIDGSAWHAPLAYDATPLKDKPNLQLAVEPLVNAGYTVFVINHRAAPRFRYPAAVEDAQRAVRFVRHHASRFGIRNDRIGAAGHSSGATLALLLGVMDGKGNPEDRDLVERESAKVQAVASLSAATDFINVPAGFVQTSYLGVVLFSPDATSSTEYRIYRDASPAYYATGGDPPILLMHGDADPLVPFRNLDFMKKALVDAGVSVSVLRIKGGAHFPPFPVNEPDPFQETVRWFDKHLLSQGAVQ
jgi:acetyl esterase/lipase